MFSQGGLLEIGEIKMGFENVSPNSSIGKIEEVKTSDLMVYLAFFDLENRLFFTLEWKVVGLGVTPRV